MNSNSWLDELEARLDRTLESFLRSNPSQEALLQEQEASDRQLRLGRERLRLQGAAKRERRKLLELAEEIRRWQERVQRARGAGAEELAGRAEAHIAALMEQGRQRWQGLGELGQSFAAVEQELQELTRPSPPATPEAPGGSDRSSTLDQDWAAFESQQELQELRRRMQR
ncbi:MAG: hercynine metabolism protein [Cyanobium sp.]